MDVLLLDDWGLAPVLDHERRDLLEILENTATATAEPLELALASTQTVAYSHGEASLPDQATRSGRTVGSLEPALLRQERRLCGGWLRGDPGKLWRPIS
jgi:hypothetical protein